MVIIKILCNQEFIKNCVTHSPVQALEGVHLRPLVKFGKLEAFLSFQWNRLRVLRAGGNC